MLRRAPAGLWQAGVAGTIQGQIGDPDQWNKHKRWHRIEGQRQPDQASIQWGVLLERRQNAQWYTKQQADRHRQPTHFHRNR